MNVCWLSAFRPDYFLIAFTVITLTRYSIFSIKINVITDSSAEISKSDFKGKTKTYAVYDFLIQECSDMQNKFRQGK